MMLWAGRLVLLAIAFALGTFAAGWWAVVLVAAVWGVVAHDLRGTVVFAGVAAGLAWAGLLSILAARGPVAELAHIVGDSIGVPGVFLFVLTVMLPAVLAAAVALVFAEIGRFVPVAITMTRARLDRIGEADPTSSRGEA